MSPITSIQNPRVKNAVRLRDRRHREKQGRILIDGSRELLRAIDAGVKLLETFVCRPLRENEDSQRLLAALPRSGGEVLEVSEAVFEKLAFGRRTEGVLGVAETPRNTLDSLSLRWGGSSTAAPTFPLVAVLEGVEKPGNVGAVLRSADAAGVSALITADPRTDLYNPNAIRASLGTIFTMPVCEATSDDALAWLRKNGFRIFAARVDSAVDYTEEDYRGPTAIVLGSEAEGLSSLWTGDDVRAVRLPMLGAADSLNVSAAAAVLFYEALRQRKGLGIGD
ncbi:MAG: RNA methyltransferase [Planctomycetes bacterium]|nr:RNA methyltransferase [Planctomycetota bacterium]MBU4399449.1 RNA methyltransferase [Planctomycetota bacterium]MCG2684526.1 RNA methyltransferase [Planctomycetales bacterium]